MISRIVREHGISAVMTMHDLNQALCFSDKFIFLKAGTIHLFGTGDDVTPDVIEDVYGIPVIIGELGGVRCIVPDHCCVDCGTMPACEMTPFSAGSYIEQVEPVRPD